MAMSNDPISQEIGLDDRPRCQETTLGDTDAQTRFYSASKQSHDLPLLEVNTSGSGEDNMEHQDDLTDVVPPTPHDSPLSRGHTPGSDEEETKNTQDKVITRLKWKVRRLEKKRKIRTSQPIKRRLFKGRVETFIDNSLGEDASKQERNDDKTEELNLTDGADTEMLVEDKGGGEKGGSTADQILPLLRLRSEKAKEKRVAFRDVEEPLRLTRSTTTLQPLLTSDPKDKGKGVLVEEEPEKLEKVKRRDQRAQKERQKQKEDTIAALTKEFDEIQARMDVDHELVVRMTHEEQEKYTIKERVRLLAEYFEMRKKQLAAKKAEVIRNKPPTRTQVKNRMITYLKHMEDEIWSNQQDWNLVSWKLYENCRVHTLLIDGTLNYFNLLVEKRRGLLRIEDLFNLILLIMASVADEDM
nr:hypothetical protein [Tanacetum cinerariifolium]